MRIPDPDTVSTYRGRFAPSPSGPLHRGSLVAAVGSYLDARRHGGQWLLRMEDVDAPRNQAGADDAILRCLESFGFEWDGEVLRQRRRLPAYAEALAFLQSSGLAYGCACSRKEIADSSAWTAIDGGLAYPGTCRAGLPPGRPARAWRLRVGNEVTSFVDRIQGAIAQQLESAVGDFVLLRADGQYAYQLAVVADDAEQGITHVVRGADLLDSTPRQIWLQRCLGLPTPSYAHLPVATNAAGEKLSKQTLAPALDAGQAARELCWALAFLGQNPPPELVEAKITEVWKWALANWGFAAIPRRRAQPAVEIFTACQARHPCPPA